MAANRQALNNVLTFQPSEHSHAPDPPPKMLYTLSEHSPLALCGQVMASVGCSLTNSRIPRLTITEM
jgi:hypothetical protein